MQVKYRTQVSISSISNRVTVTFDEFKNFKKLKNEDDLAQAAARIENDVDANLNETTGTLLSVRRLC
jgi:hypothetical protein